MQRKVKELKWLLKEFGYNTYMQKCATLRFAGANLSVFYFQFIYKLLNRYITNI